MKLLNVGCGSRFHEGWVNVDMVSHSPRVITHDLIKGIPFSDDTFDVVYHSHVLEHFARQDGGPFMRHCHRVLKPGGIIRVAVPDLEGIIANYNKSLVEALSGEPGATANYDWTMLELYDQTVRNSVGGEMRTFLTQDEVPNERFIRGRLGRFYETVRGSRRADDHSSPITLKATLKKVTVIRRSHELFKHVTRKLSGTYRELGRFRLSGEMHLWMYDRFSLARLLTRSGFKDPLVCDAVTSRIPDWKDFNLDTDVDGQIYKADSLFMEATK